MSTRLVYNFNEVTSSPGFGASQTRLRYQYNEVSADPAFGPHQSRLRYHFVEVTTKVTITTQTYRPIVMCCT